ncbi:MAG: outer membrane lipoprotein carrier protein LolA [Desulfobacterales bacterium]|nr:outer membrane lipoprotein carrier protein LolA [Desulfobacterales bacterium]
MRNVLLFAMTIWMTTVFAPLDLFGDEQAAKQPPTLDEILAGVEKRYAGSGFSARFDQTSILKAMDIKDTASGTILIKRPGKMRWEYETPERQLIITDGVQLWIHRPDDNQVTIGDAPTFFGDGKGAGFLSDMRLVREKFKISLENAAKTGSHVLKLLPAEKTPDVTEIFLTVAVKTFEIREIVTYNTYGDETLIVLSDITFLQEVPDSRFTFTPSEGADVIRLEN